MRIASSRKLGIVLSLTALFTASCGDNDSPTAPAGPQPPTAFAATATGATSARLTFTGRAGDASYTIQRATGATGGTFAQVATAILPASGTSVEVVDAGLQPSTTYRYRVATVRNGQTSAFTAELSVTTLAAGAEGTRTISANITSDQTLYTDTTYTLSGFIQVTNGATLTIQPGTTIKGTYGSALFVLRGAKIRAVGTAALPIVFTSNEPVGSRKPGDWGGLVIVGNARINRSSPVILEGTGTNAGQAPTIDYSGGTDDADDSGELRYVRVEFAGFATAPEQELNSFTFAAVGSGTKFGYLQSVSGLDDSYEFFGGQADGHHFVSYESGDDHFDMSEGYQGRLQYLIAFQSKVLVPRTGAGTVSGDPQGIENDGCAGANCLNGQASQPYTIPLVANFTLVGTGANAAVEATSGGIGMMLRRGTGGYYVNGVVARWPRAGVSIRDQATNDRATAGDLQLKNILFAEVPVMFQPQTPGSSTLQFSVDSTANALERTTGTAASLFTALPASPASGAAFDWTPATGSPARTGGLATFSGQIQAKAGTTVTGTAFRGAADPSGAKWWADWTRYYQN